MANFFFFTCYSWAGVFFVFSQPWLLSFTSVNKLGQICSHNEREQILTKPYFLLSGVGCGMSLCTSKVSETGHDVDTKCCSYWVMDVLYSWMENSWTLSDKCSWRKATYTDGIHLSTVSAAISSWSPVEWHQLYWKQTSYTLIRCVS